VIDLHDLLRQLIDQPLTLGEARRSPREGGIPAEPGIYSWWTTTREALPGVPAQLGEGRSGFLLYVGISPRNASSAQGLRSRVCSNHMAGNIGGSTFRLSLASLLWRSQGWQPVWKGDRAQLSRDHNKALSEWQREHLRIGWVVCPKPWLQEPPLIGRLSPPMNLAENKDHPLHATMSAARGALREEALRYAATLVDAHA
jgi:hypothetical protein